MVLGITEGARSPPKAHLFRRPPPLQRSRPRRITPPRSPAPQLKSCQTCWELQITGPDDTSASTAWDFTEYKSCASEGWSSDPSQNPFPDCCAKFQNLIYFFFENKTFYYSGSLTKDLVTINMAQPVDCYKGSLIMCGKVTGDRLGHELASKMTNDEEDYEDLQTDFITGFLDAFESSYTRCPQALIDSSVRIRSVTPANQTQLDSTCFPLDTRIGRLRCGLKTLDDTLDADSEKFPPRSCDNSTTPWAVEPYQETVRFPDYPDVVYECVRLTLTTPANPESTCGQATSLDEVAFWLHGNRSEVRENIAGYGVWLRTKGADGQYTMDNRLTVAWSTTNRNVMYARALGLEAEGFEALQPQICFGRPSDGSLDLPKMARMERGTLYAALYDKSGACCPVYNSNRY
ncbi:hypothetical protein HYH03_015240 [Edaphochlamys debaryana]|uniref:Pherophorin domain-containing protein n=1 Tax=Edaphochlamys debaryana TaxID=47281 RepID=A0A835XJR8_9CHLO|nr:hypothetical protein HYH03_015240 [Edaphochlamys debaryana]|eukprot:KAG2486032.1 hypothetical protein HYH03_015240 [Edaphochlamys debaryana]